MSRHKISLNELEAADEAGYVVRNLLGKPPSFTFYVSCLSVFSLVLFLFASTTKVSLSVVAEGQIVSSAGLIFICAPQSGVISNILVEAGDELAKGDVLAEIVEPFGIDAPGDISDFRLERIEQELEILRDRRLGYMAAKADIRRSTEVQIATLNSQLASYQDLQSLYANTVRQLADDLAKQQQLLGSGLGTADAVRAIQRDLDRQRAQQIQVELELLRTSESIQSISARTEASILDFNVRIADTEMAIGERSDLELRTSQIKSAQVFAPGNGTVAAVLKQEGASVQSPGEPLFEFSVATLDKAPVLIEVLVGSEDLTDTRVGSDVKVEVLALRVNQFCLFFGTVNSISLTSLSPEQRDQLGVTSNQKDLFRVEIKLDAESSLRLRSYLSVRPGLAIRSYLTTDEPTVLELLFDPVLRAFSVLSEQPNES